MLIGFKVKNFRSFDSLQHFSMVAGKTRSFIDHIAEKEDLKLLKFSAIYGANASGKSNLIRAINFSRELILYGLNNSMVDQYFRLISNRKNSPTYFEYEIAVDDKLFSYGFEVNLSRQEIVSEWLLDMSKTKMVKIFERDCQKQSITTDLKVKNKEDAQKFEVCLSDMKNNKSELLLTEMTRRMIMAKKVSEELGDFISISYFLSHDLQVIMPGSDRDIQFNYFSEYKNDIKSIMKKLGINIEELIEVDTTLNDIKEKLNISQYNKLMSEIEANRKKDFDMTLRIGNSIYTIMNELNSKELKIKAIKLRHQNSNEYFDTYEESDGTIRILELLDVLLSDNKVFVIDEIDRSLHPSLTKEFIKNFLSLVSEKNVQLIITTHESRLLDFDLLRRDEIWFVEKDNDDASKLYSLEQFKDFARFDRKIDKAYLDGRFGAIPKFVSDWEYDDENNDE